MNPLSSKEYMYVVCHGRFQMWYLQMVIRRDSVHLELNDESVLTKLLVKPVQRLKEDPSRGIRNSKACQLVGFIEHKINLVRKQPDTHGQRFWSFWVLTCTPSTPSSGWWATKTLLILAMSSISFNFFRIIDISWRALLQWFPTGPQTWKFV